MASSPGFGWLRKCGYEKYKEWGWRTTVFPVLINAGGEAGEAAA